MELATLDPAGLDAATAKTAALGVSHFIERRAQREPTPANWVVPLRKERSPSLRDADPSATVRELVAWLQGMLSVLRAGRSIRRPQAITDALIWDPSAPLGSDGRCRRSWAPPEDTRALALFVDRVFDLFDEVGPWLALCARDGCGRFFLVRRAGQRYCSASCANKVAMQTYLASGGRRGRPSRRRPMGGK